MRGECEWAAPEQSRGGASLFGPFHMSACRGLLSNGPWSIDQLREPSPAESNLRGVDSPMKISHPARETEHGGLAGVGDAQGLCHLRKFVLIIRHLARACHALPCRCRTQYSLRWDEMTKHLTATFSVCRLREVLAHQLGGLTCK